MKTEHEINKKIADLKNLIDARVEYVKMNPCSPSCRHYEDAIKQLYREIDLLKWVLS